MNAARIAELRALHKGIQKVIGLGIGPSGGFQPMRLGGLGVEMLFNHAAALPEALDAIERVRALAVLCRDEGALLSGQLNADDRFAPTDVIPEFAVTPEAILAALAGPKP